MPFFVEDRFVSGNCGKEMAIATSESVSAKFNGEATSRSRESGEPEFSGSLSGEYSWGSQVTAVMKDTHFKVSNGAPTPSRSVHAETNDSRIAIPFMCYAKVSNSGTANDADNSWLPEISPGVASGTSIASASIGVASARCYVSAIPAPLP